MYVTAVWRYDVNPAGAFNGAAQPQEIFTLN